LESDAVIILGNEANGISDKVSAFVNKKLTIPQFGQQQLTESLNVAMATAIFLSEFKK
jgi:TrmH family RNA methyltransferase